MRTLIVGANNGFTYHDIEKALLQAKIKKGVSNLHVIGSGARGFDRLVVQYGENNNIPCMTHGMQVADNLMHTKMAIDSIARQFDIGHILILWNGQAFNKGNSAWTIAKMKGIPYFIYNTGESEDEDEN